MTVIKHNCALSPSLVELPKFPYEVRVSQVPLKNELNKDFSFKKLIELWGACLDDELKFPLPIEKIEAMRWLLTPWVPYEEMQDQWTALSAPFSMKILLSQPKFEKNFLDEQGKLIAKSHIDPDLLQRGRVLKAIEWILYKVYGHSIQFNTSIIFMNENELGLPQYYQFKFDQKFIDVEYTGDLPDLKKIDLEQFSMTSESSIEDWLQVFSPKQFKFKGFSLISASTVTHKEAMNGFHRELSQGTLIDMERLKRLQKYLSIMTNAPDIFMRIFIFMDNQLKLVQPSDNNNPGCVLANSVPVKCDEIKQSPYVEVLESKVQKWFKRHEFDGVSFMENDNIKEDIFLIPLVNDSKVIGVLEISVEKKFSLQTLDLFTMGEIVNSISDAIRKSLEQLDHRVQQVVQEHCTALHRSIRWRFDQEARVFLTKSSLASFDEIVFNEIHPLFSQSDIQSSSHFRNEAIKNDLEAQLELAKDVLEQMNSIKEMPILGGMLFKLENCQNRLKNGLQSSDELHIQNFLKNTLERVFEELSYEDSKVQASLKAYNDTLDPQYKMIHANRAKYEESVNLINQEISSMIDKEQVKAQAMIPHYSEKTQTDGVELSMYLGESMLEDFKWSNLHIENLRLWQLLLMCHIARKCNEMKSSLPIPLEMTHLILVQDMPLTIRFSTEAKEFIVDGAYNIRYAIIKKRIDKAMIAGTKNERLTQPGKIAIVYSHISEAQSYREFFNYLIKLGLIHETIEDLELEELQNLQGMRALRVTVMHERRKVSRGPEPALIERAIKNK